MPICLSKFIKIFVKLINFVGKVIINKSCSVLTKKGLKVACISGVLTTDFSKMFLKVDSKLIKGSAREKK